MCIGFQSRLRVSLLSKVTFFFFVGHEVKSEPSEERAAEHFDAHPSADCVHDVLWETGVVCVPYCGCWGGLLLTVVEGDCS